MRAAKLDTDLAILAQRPPDLNITLPESLVYEAWLEYERTGRYFDSDLPPDLWDRELRENVRSYKFYWEYTRAHLKQERQ